MKDIRWLHPQGADPTRAPSLTDLRDLFQLLDGLPTGVVLLDAEGKVLRVNALAAQRLGVSGAEVLGRDLFRDALPELERQGQGAEYRRQATLGTVAMEWEFQCVPDPRERTLWLAARSFSFNQALWVALVVEDRTELAQERESRRRAERMAAVGELAAGVAHEVNNPLASIQSFAQLLARDARGAEQHRALEIIIQECTRISRVVENLLSFAHQQGIKGREPVNLSAVAERVLELQSYALGTAGIEVRKDLDESLSPVMGEAGALQQVVLNLVVNAEQALAGKQGHRLLVVRTRESSEGVVLSVVDNGPGIPRERLAQVFDPLADSRGYDPGLGLGICATIVREHGGQIMAESEEGRGAAFFVRLPRAGADPVPAVAAAPVPASTSERGEEARRPLRVLVADDEATLRLAISLFLGRRGHKVTQASDAWEALRLAEENEFDVALVDARMPGDGLRLLEQLEAMPSLRGRTALMTGDLGRARTSQGITTGRPYLVKPFDMNDAVGLIEKLGQ